MKPAEFESFTEQLGFRIIVNQIVHIVSGKIYAAVYVMYHTVLARVILGYDDGIVKASLESYDRITQLLSAG